MKRLRTSFFVTLAMVGALLSGCGDKSAPASNGDLATLAAGVEGFRDASPDTSLEFPADHGAHNDYRIEWWYLTANLRDNAGQPFGAQWTLFRVAQRPPIADDQSLNPWQTPQVYMAHFAISTTDQHRAFQRYARGGSHAGQARAGARVEPFAAWMDNWYLKSAGSQAWLPLQVYARQDNFAMNLILSSEQALILQGEAGFSRKHPNGGGSHYYSHPFLSAEGELEIDGETVSVSGQAWLDREWSSQFLQADQSGWDWFALHLDSGEKLMLFRLRETGVESANYHHGVLISPTGTKRDLDPSMIHFEIVERSALQGRRIPTSWRLTLGGIDREILVTALRPNQWMNVDFPYWEGPVTASGKSPGESGQGYLEMVGYPIHR